MNRKTLVLSALLIAGFGLSFFTAQQVIGEDAASTAAAAEKEKAMKNPYPNDFGPATVDVSKYTPEQQEGYKLLQDKCAKCHSASRPLNSQFVDMKPEELAAAKQKTPEIFKDKQVWQVESGIWQRYIKRMMAKPGCNISDAEGKKIFRFMLEDSKRRKTGANAATWAAHRKKLMTDFKARHPDKYKELFETQ